MDWATDEGQAETPELRLARFLHEDHFFNFRSPPPDIPDAMKQRMHALLDKLEAEGPARG